MTLLLLRRAVPPMLSDAFGASRSFSSSAGLLLNYERYPIDKRGHAAYDVLLNNAKAALRTQGCFRLPNFVTPAGVEHAKRECLGAIFDGQGGNAKGILGNQVGRAVNCYYEAGDESLPVSHPQNTFFNRSFGVLRDDMIGNGALRKIYDEQHLVNFVSDVLEAPRIFQSRDSYQALTVNVMKEGESLHWHFDCNACAVTLGIQVPERGGQLEFVPNIGRTNYDAITSVLEEEDTALESFEYDTGEGELVFFCGGESIHRVKAVEGGTLRLVAALQFHTSDGAYDSPEMTQRIYGVPEEEHLGPKKNVVCSSSSI